MTISDIGMEEWLEVPTPCDPECQITLDLSGPEQWPMEPMPPCMEFFQVEILSVMMKCTSIIFFTFLEVSFFSFQVHSEHLCSLTAHSGMWPQPPPGGFLVPPFYCPVSAEIICGPRRPLAQQPAPQCFLLTKSESRIERGSEVSAESPKTSKKEGRAAADPQLTQSSDDEEKPSLAKFPKRKILTKTKKTSLSSTSKRRSILESTESAKHSKHEGRTGNETPKQLKEEPPNMTDSSEEEVKEEDVKPRLASSGNMRGGAGVSARSVLTFNELIQIAIDGKQPPLKLDAETSGDGSCFSYATCQQCERPGVKLYLQSRGIQVKDIFHLKQQVREFVERNSQSEKILNLKRNFMLSRKIPLHLLSRSWTHYWEEMQKRKTWADDVFLWCTAFFLKVDLRIIFAGAETEGQADTVVSGKFTEDDVEDLPVLYYGYVVDLHYQSLIPVEEAPITLKCLEKKSIDSTLDQVLRALKHPSSQQGNEVSRRKLLYFIFYM